MPPPASARNEALLVALLYILVAGMWIFASDRVLISVFDVSPERLTEFQTYKGWAFVLITGLLLFSGLFRILKVRERCVIELVQSNQTLTGLIEASPLAVVAFDGDGKVTLWNPAAERTFGWRKEEVLGGALPFSTDEGEDRDEELPLRLGTAGSLEGEEFTLKTKDGRRREVAVWTSSLDGPGEHPLEAIALLADVSEKRVLERQLRQAQKMEIVGQLAGGVAHDFNNLLTGITGFTEMAVENLGDPQRSRRDLVSVLDLCDRASRLTRQLLTFGRKGRLEPSVFNPNPLVENTSQLMQRLLKDGVRLDFRLDENLGRVRADPGQFDQVLMNLILNARDALTDDGRIRVQTKNAFVTSTQARCREGAEPGKYVAVSVSDTGSGMSPETVERIFQPFFTTKGADRGTGLGLAVVYGIVRQHGGHIVVTSRPGEGSRFEVFWPRLEAPDDQPESSLPEQLLPVGSETVLVIDDEETIRRLAERMLSRLGYTVLEASDPEEAERVFATYPGNIHLLVTDVLIPGTGIEQVLKRLSARNPDLKILHMSGCETKKKGAQAAGVAFLFKPFSPSALARAVRRLLDSRPVSRTVEFKDDREG